MLAATGRRFERAYCQDAICIPSRASLATGSYRRDPGILHNADWRHINPERRYPPWQQVFKATGMLGKHHVSYTEIAKNWSQSTVISERYKLGVWVEPGCHYQNRDWRSQTPDQLFDRVSDPHEMYNLIGNLDFSQVEDELRAALAAWWPTTPATGRQFVDQSYATAAHETSSIHLRHSSLPRPRLGCL